MSEIHGIVVYKSDCLCQIYFPNQNRLLTTQKRLELGDVVSVSPSRQLKLLKRCPKCELEVTVLVERSTEFFPFVFTGVDATWGRILIPKSQLIAEGQKATFTIAYNDLLFPGVVWVAVEVWDAKAERFVKTSAVRPQYIIRSGLSDRCDFQELEEGVPSTAAAAAQQADFLAPFFSAISRNYNDFLSFPVDNPTTEVGTPSIEGEVLVVQKSQFFAVCLRVDTDVPGFGVICSEAKNFSALQCGSLGSCLLYQVGDQGFRFCVTEFTPRSLWPMKTLSLRKDDNLFTCSKAAFAHTDIMPISNELCRTPIGYMRVDKLVAGMFRIRKKFVVPATLRCQHGRIFWSPCVDQMLEC